LIGSEWRRTSDVDEAQAAMASTFLPLRLRLTERSGSCGVGLRLNATRVGDATVAYARFDRAVQVITAEAEHYHLDLPISGSATFRSGRRELVEGTPRRAAVFMPDEPAAIDWDGGCGQLCLMFPRHVLHRELEAMLDRPVSAPLSFAAAMDVSVGAGREWADALRLVERQARYVHGLLHHPLAVGNLERLLVEGLLLAQPHNYSDALAQPRLPAAPPAVRQAIELIRTIPSSHGPPRPWPGASPSAPAAFRTASPARSASRRLTTCETFVCIGCTMSCGRPTRA
jgi:AraC-binding-like domain